MSKPLMSKATAVWLVDNTTLTFKQVADFCGMHELEVHTRLRRTNLLIRPAIRGVWSKLQI